MLCRDNFYLYTPEFYKEAYGFDTQYYINDIITLFTNEKKVSC